MPTYIYRNTFCRLTMHALDLESVRNDFLKTVTRRAPVHLELAHRTLTRVSPARWQMEWNLPRWLGETFGLAQAIAREFVLSNVLGLVAIRLQDDLADGDVAIEEIDSANELARALYTAALEIYHPYFPRQAMFWTRVENYMREWRDATTMVNALNVSDLNELNAFESKAAQCLVQLGAPRKISAFAVCELTQPEKYPALNQLLDHAFIAAVLHDHAVDLDKDLRAGRWNLFVAAVSSLPQSRAREQANRKRVAQAWLTRASPREYFQATLKHVECAQQLNRALQIGGLEIYLDQLCLDIQRTHDTLSEQFANAFARMAEKLFNGQALSPRTTKGGTTSLASPPRSNQHFSRDKEESWQPNCKNKRSHPKRSLTSHIGSGS